jgi:hypothetical protein
MLYWLFQVVYVTAIGLWLTSVILLLREFFQSYRGKVYDDSALSQKAGRTPHEGALEARETEQYIQWKTEKTLRVKKLLRLFAAGIAVQAVLHLTQSWFMPRFEIPFSTNPVPQNTEEEMPPEE